MSHNRFKELKRYLRCDDMSTQEVRKTGEQGEMVAIHELW